MIGPGEFGSSVLGSPEVLLHWRSRANDAGICSIVAVSESVFPFRVKEGRGGHVKVTAVIVKLHSFPNFKQYTHLRIPPHSRDRPGRSDERTVLKLYGMRRTISSSSSASSLSMSKGLQAASGATRLGTSAIYATDYSPCVCDSSPFSQSSTHSTKLDPSDSLHTSRLLVNHYLDTYTYHHRPQLSTTYAYTLHQSTSIRHPVIIQSADVGRIRRTRCCRITS